MTHFQDGFHLNAVRQAKRRLWLGPFHDRRQVRSFQMKADQFSTARTLCDHLPQHAEQDFQFIQTAGNQRGSDQGRAVSCVLLCDRTERRFSPVHEIVSAAAVTVDVDKTRYNIAAPGIQFMLYRMPVI